MKSKLIYSILRIILGTLLLGIGILMGYLARISAEPAQASFALLDEAQILLEDNYLGELPDDLVLQRGMIAGMIDKVEDPFTTFVEPASNELQTDDLSGQFGGIGARLMRDEDGLVFIIPFPGGPAAQANVSENDALVAVDGVRLSASMETDEIVALIRGPIGSSVLLTFQSSEPGSDDIDIEIVRIKTEIPSVSSYLMPGEDRVGIIVLARFSEKSAEEVKRDFLSLLDQGAKGIILDLRGNSGGLLDSAIAISRFFLPGGTILTEKEKGGVERQYKARSPGLGADVPLSVLVNGGTASAAEIVAAALQENNRAQLVGENTFGKGSVQSILALSDGSSLHVTIARWTTPDGFSIDGVGIAPDFEVAPMDGPSDAVLLAGLKIVVDLILVELAGGTT
ncbi:MAG: peptidase S41 [Chloroflexi bacterium]|nr:peptidase S41 [Chloroflexota bacterium]